MKKGLILGRAVFLLISSIFVLAQEEECGFWCKFGEMLWGTGEGEKTLVGKAGGIWGREEAVVGKAGERGLITNF